MQQPPTSLNPPEGSPTFNLDRSTGTLVCKFNRWEVEPALIAKAIRDSRHEHGDNAVRFIDVLICAEVQAGPTGVLLIHLGFERRPDENNGKTAMYRWRKKAKQVKKNGETKE